MCGVSSHYNNGGSLEGNQLISALVGKVGIVNLVIKEKKDDFRT